MKTTLLIMAAGLGSRYGGNNTKQTDQLGPNGEMLMEYSIHDAVRAGFDRFVFVIRRSMENTFIPMIRERLSPNLELSFAFQEYDSLPGRFSPPPDRTKPYGTVHAVLCASDIIREPFAVINADDYYGREAFAVMADSLRCMRGKESLASMVAYLLKNTVSENGEVTRGLCKTGDDGKLVEIIETSHIVLLPDGSICSRGEDGSSRTLDPDTLVSMNFWGFSPDIMKSAADEFSAFLRDRTSADPLKKEFPLPVLVDRLMRTRGLQADVLSSKAHWFGVTWQDDRSSVRAALQRLHDTGYYPPSLHK